MHSDQCLREAELAFLNAPFLESGWQLALEQLSIASRTRTVQLIGVGGPLALSLNLMTSPPHDPNGHLGNPLLYGSANWRINTSAGPLTLEHEPHYRAYRSDRHTEIYDDAVNDLDLPFGCQSALLLDEGSLVGLALLRSGREGVCQADVLDTFARLSWQAQRAARVQLALGREAGEAMLTGPGCGSEATLLLDRFGALVALSAGAEALFDHPRGLRLRGLAVELTDPDEQSILAAALNRLLTGDVLGGPVLHQGVVGRCADRPLGRWRLFATRLPRSLDTLGLAAQLCLTLKPI